MDLKRVSSLLCAAGMACAALPAVGEGAAPGGVSQAARALTRLLFETDNVTVETDASFTYDGVQFKTIHGILMQDDYNTDIKADYFTVRPDGSSYSTYWRVHAVGDEVWSFDSHNGKYYSENYCEPSSSVVSHDADDDTLISMTGAAMELVDLALPSVSAVEETAGGKRITVSLKKGQVPAYLNSVADLLIDEAAWRYMSLNLNYSEYNDEGFPMDMGYEYSDSVEYCFEDDYLLMMKLLSGLKGEEVTEEDLAEMYEQSDPLIDAAYAAVYAIADKTAEGHTGGIVYVAADGSSQWYASQTEMILDRNLHSIYYEDEDAAFIAFVKQTTGETLTENDISGIYWGNNMDLWDAYEDLSMQMEEHYLSLLGDHPLGYVGRDGILVPVDDIDSLPAPARYDEGIVSIANYALMNKASVSVGDCSFVFDLDAEGRVTAVSADVALDFINRDGSVHPVTMKLTAAATAYGETEVGDFDPDEWGVPDFATYYNTYEPDMSEEVESIPADLPETVTLNGVTYPVFTEE